MPTLVPNLKFSNWEYSVKDNGGSRIMQAIHRGYLYFKSHTIHIQDVIILGAYFKKAYAATTHLAVLWCLIYCAFHKHANSKVQKPPSQLRFSLSSIIITITSNEPWNTETQNGSKSTNHRSQTFWTCLGKVLFAKRSVKMIDEKR